MGSGSELIGFRIPNQIWITDSIIVDSGFQPIIFCWIPDSVTWAEFEEQSRG